MSSIHDVRFLSLSIVDLLGTLAGAVLLIAGYLYLYPQTTFKQKSELIVSTFILLWLIGIYLHVLFDVSTPITRFIGFK